MLFLTFVTLVTLLGGTAARATLLEQYTGLYELKIDNVSWAEVLEKVYDDPLTDGQKATVRAYGYNPDAYGQWYTYRYTVVNDRFPDPPDGNGLWCWGYDDPNDIGIPAVCVNSPAGWTANWDCTNDAGSTLGWTDGGNPIPYGDSLDSFWIASPGHPHAMYDAIAHGDPNNINTPKARGQVSGPGAVPEPMSMTLLGVALAGGLASLRKRRRR